MSVERQDAPTATPTDATDRISALDGLRGVAVLGIFAINIVGFSLPEAAFDHPKEAGGGGAINYGLWTGAQLFVEGSMRGLFSMLFGAGVILFTERAERAATQGGRSVAALWYRRTGLLVLFGLFHAYALLMPGDILLIYGLAGAFVFLVRKAEPRALLLAAGAVAAVYVASAAATEVPEIQSTREIASLDARSENGEPLSGEERARLDGWAADREWLSPEAQAEEILDRTGNISRLYRSNAELVSSGIGPLDLAWWVIDAAMMMMFGMALYRLGVLRGTSSDRFYVTLAVAGYGFGLSLRSIGLWERWEADFSPVVATPWVLLQPMRIAMTLGHVGMFFILWRRFETAAPFRILSAAGRMAFTNYIGQTIIANLVFSGLGLGLYGQLDLAGVYVVMLGIWTLQLAFSVWWLRRHRFGPLEWVWRGLTYGRAPAMLGRSR